MRISDWSSDVCSSDLRGSSCAASAARPSRQAGLRVRSVVPGLASQRCLIHPPPCAAFRHPPGFSTDGEGSDRTSVVSGKSVSVSVDRGGRRLIKKKKKLRQTQYHEQVSTEIND